MSSGSRTQNLQFPHFFLASLTTLPNLNQSFLLGEFHLRLAGGEVVPLCPRLGDGVKKAKLAILVKTASHNADCVSNTANQVFTLGTLSAEWALDPPETRVGNIEARARLLRLSTVSP